MLGGLLGTSTYTNTIMGKAGTIASGKTNGASGKTIFVVVVLAGRQVKNVIDMAMGPMAMGYIVIMLVVYLRMTMYIIRTIPL